MKLPNAADTVTKIDAMLEMANLRGPLLDARVNDLYVDGFDIPEALAFIIGVLKFQASDATEFARKGHEMIPFLVPMMEPLSIAIRVALLVGYCQAHDDIQKEVIRV